MNTLTKSNIDIKSISANNNTMASITVKSNIEETLIEWFGSNGLEIKDIETHRDPGIDPPRLYMAKGEFKPCLFDKEMDGTKLEIRFQLEVAMQDERFGGCDLVFTGDTTFKII